MNPHTAELVAHLDENRRMLRAAVDEVPAGLRERRPAADRWSVVEVLEHLAIVENRVTSRLGDALAGARERGIPAETHTGSVLDRSFLDRVVDRSQRFKTSEAAEPRGGLDIQAAWARLDQARGAFLGLLTESDGLAVGRITAPHPFFGQLSFYQWAVFLAAHDARHAAQIREVHAALSAGAGPPRE